MARDKNLRPCLPLKPQERLIIILLIKFMNAISLVENIP